MRSNPTTRLRQACLLASCLLGLAAPADAADPNTLSVETDSDGVTVLVDGELFAKYLKKSGNKPILWPIVGPAGQPLTRGYPMAEKGPLEEADHKHHRSLWFGYEGINGIDFWHEPQPSTKRRLPIGTIQHKRFMKAESDGRTAAIISRNDYQSDSGKVVARDERTMQFGASDGARWIDFRIRLWSEDSPLHIGDTKEGAFAIRVSGEMKVDAGQGGQILNSNGEAGVDAWGVPAEWAMYSGPTNAKMASIAILAHPSSYNPRPCWHVRPYGLFAANPFGKAAYNQPTPGGYKAAAGEPVLLRYRLLLHDGRLDGGEVAEIFARYAKTP